MNTNLKNKKLIVDEIASKIQNAKSMVVVRYHGLNVENLTDLRNTLRKNDVEFKVYKNTLVHLALKKLNIKDLDHELVGPNGLVFSNSDEVIGPKLLADFAKKAKNLILQAAIFEGSVVNKTELMEIANLPSREALLTMIASLIISPLRNFILAIKAIAEKKEQTEQN